MSTKSCRPEMATNAQIQRALREAWQGVWYVARARLFGAIEVLYTSENVVWQHSVLPVRSEEFILYPTYMGRKTTTVRIKNISPDIDIWWVASCVVLEAEDGVLDVRTSGRDAWTGTSLEILLQASPEHLEKIPDHIALPNARDLIFQK